MQFFEAVTTGTVYVDSHLSVVRRRAVTVGFEETIEIENHAKEPVDLEVKLEAASDFADLFEVKDKLAKVGELYSKVTDGALTLGYRRGTFVRETIIKADKKGEVRERRVRVPGQDPGAVVLVGRLRRRGARAAGRHRGRRDAAPDGRTAGARSWPGASTKWVASAPRLVASWEPLQRIYRRSLVDLAALRFEIGIVARGAARGGPALVHGGFRAGQPAHQLPGAGVRARAGGRHAARAGDPAGARPTTRSATSEPGKILHEIRLGEMTAFEDRPQSPYYGAADATMLFLILLEEYDRWTGDTRRWRASWSARRARR